MGHGVKGFAGVKDYNVDLSVLVVEVEKILGLNCLKFEHFQKSSVSEFHSTCVAYLNDLLSNELFFTVWACKILEYLKLYELDLFCTR